MTGRETSEAEQFLNELREGISDISPITLEMMADMEAHPEKYQDVVFPPPAPEINAGELDDRIMRLLGETGLSE